jgi:cytochrome c-type biogenesis protein CcmH/NrfG
MSTEPTATRSPRFALIAALVVVVLAAAGAGVWYFASRVRPPESTADLAAASEANARGVGWMEHFQYAKATAAFEEAIHLAPDWLPARINHGIALFQSASDSPDSAAILMQSAAEFEEVLRREPDNPYGHFNLGVIAKYRGETSQAAPHFEAVTRIDPTDAHAWLYLGQCEPNPQESPRARECFETALKLNPYLYTAQYMLTQHASTDAKQQAALLELSQQLVRADWWAESGVKYTEVGRYATVIGASAVPPPAVGPMPLFGAESQLSIDFWPPAPEWADGAKLGDVRRAVRDRFGGVLVRLDYNRDGKPDLLLLSAVVRAGEPRDVLLRNDGGGKFIEVTAETGLDKHPGSLACAVGDFDNDGKPDLVLAGPTGVRLFRNGETRFEDKTKEAGLDKLAGACVAACWVDLDQDGDLDLLLGKQGTDGQLAVFLNVGEAPPAPANAKTPPLKVAFRPLNTPDALLVKGPIVGIVATDLDADGDVDLLVQVDGQPPVVVLNDRLLRFHRGDGLSTVAAQWAGGLILDANGDDQSDLFVLSTRERPMFLVGKSDHPGLSLAERFASGATDSPILLQAQRADLDLDGRADVVGLSHERKPVFLQGGGLGKLTSKPEPFGPAAAQLPDLLAVAACDVDGDGNPDLIAWSASMGLRFFRNHGNGNHGVKLALTGVHENKTATPGHRVRRTNADGIGAKAAAQTGSLRGMFENTTLSSGPGQSLVPVEIGIGRATEATATRVRWPDGVVQSELSTPAGVVTTIAETDRKPDSCPVLFTWDGAKWVYITDFLGAGAVGELGPDGSARPPRPEESVKIEPGQLAAKDGAYLLRIAEPMDEVLYLDQVRLDVIDHPADLFVFPDERFVTAGPPPSLALLAFHTRVFPAKVIDHRGRDVTATLRERDGRTVNEFAARSWAGFAEDHFIELDFAERLKQLPANRPVYLILAGWTDYAYPDSIFAAEQAGVPMRPPVLERQTSGRAWQALGEIGFPAGLPRVMTVDVSRWLKDGGTKFRIRTNLRVYWDQAYLAPLAEKPGEPGATARVHRIEPSRANLAYRGMIREIVRGDRSPITYDPERTVAAAVNRWRGNLTRLGDVTELLTRADDRFAVCGPGDEVALRFDANRLPAIPRGWVRSFVLRSRGYCKGASTFTVTGGQVEPLPHSRMRNYPEASAPRRADQVRWNTRPVP